MAGGEDSGARGGAEWPRGRGLLIGAAIGSGISAQTAARGGVDFLLAVNAGRMRNMAAPSIASMLPGHSATAMSEAFAAREVLPRVEVPVLLGVNCWDPGFDRDRTVARIADMGFAGAVNFPNATLLPPELGRQLDASGRGYRCEIALLKTVEEAGLLALYYCGTRAHAAEAARAGLGMVLLNFGWNAGGLNGHRRHATLEEVGVVARNRARLIRRLNPSARILLEGGPVVTADDLGQVAAVASLDGYVGGSTLDRLPFEESVLNTVASYRQAADRRRALDARQGGLVRWASHHGIVGTSDALLASLGEMRGLSRAARSVAVTLEGGTPVAPLLSALTGRAELLQLDFGEREASGRIARRLFGRDDGEVAESGFLTDPRIGTVVVWNAHLALPRVQRRLASSLSGGTLITSGRRRRLRVATRCLFLFEVDAGDPQMPETLEGALAGYLAGWTISVPPLRDRVADLPDLIAAVARRAGLVPGRVPSLSPGAMQRLMRHPWPGNEAELERLVGRMATGMRARRLGDGDVAAMMEATNRTDAPPSGVAELERRRIVEALRRNDFHRGRTAEALHITRKTLYNRMRKFGLSD